MGGDHWFGWDYLKFDLMKLSHHGSKPGSASSCSSESQPHNSGVISKRSRIVQLPHPPAMEAVREARQPTTNDSADRNPDYALGYTRQAAD